METAQEAIIRKIKALLRKAEGTNNEHETAAFAAAAQRLIAKYNVEQTDLQEKKIEIGLRRYELTTKHRWRKKLLSAITTTNFCRYVFYKGNSKHISLLGEAHNIDMCLLLYEYLAKEIVRLSQVAYERETPPIGAREWKHNFCAGATDTVYTRLFQQYEYMRQGQSEKKNAADEKVEKIAGHIEAPNASKMRALIVVQDAALTEAYQKHFRKAQPTASNYFNFRAQAERPGYHEGVAAGQSIQINVSIK